MKKPETSDLLASTTGRDVSLTSKFNKQPVRIHEVYERIAESNPLSGHHWHVNGKLIGYDVTGGGFLRTRHSKKIRAEEEAQQRINFGEYSRERY